LPKIQRSTINDPDDPDPKKHLGFLQTQRPVFKKLAPGARDQCGEGKSKYYRSPGNRQWKTFPVTVFINVSGYKGKETDRVVYDEVVSLFKYINNEVGFELFRIVEGKTQAKLTFEWAPLEGSTTGRCTTSYSGSTIKKVTIKLDNSSRSWFINPKPQCHSSGTKYHFPSTAMHEIGHGLGLAHNETDKLATMRPYINRGETLRDTPGLSERTFLKDVYRKYAT
jgi:hypothetical protein